MTLRLKDKVALVTGAGSVGPGWGNGKAMAVLFAREGAAVFCVDRDADAATATVALIEGEGGRASAHVADVTDAAQVASMVAACHEVFGGIHVLVNNVGGSAPGGPVEMDEAVWDRQMDHNLKHVYLVTKAVLPLMEAGGGGAVVNLGSIAGLRHIGYDHAAYAAAKAGIVQFTRAVAVQYAARGVRLNTVIPGLMHTPLVEARLATQRGDGSAEEVARIIAERDAAVPMGKMGDAWDVAHAALFLASDEAKYVTGTEILVDGGLSVKAVTPPA